MVVVANGNSKIKCVISILWNHKERDEEMFPYNLAKRNWKEKWVSFPRLYFLQLKTASFCELLCLSVANFLLHIRIRIYYTFWVLFQYGSLILLPAICTFDFCFQSVFFQIMQEYHRDVLAQKLASRNQPQRPSSQNQRQQPGSLDQHQLPSTTKELPRSSISDVVRDMASLKSPRKQSSRRGRDRRSGSRRHRHKGAASAGDLNSF